MIRPWPDVAALRGFPALGTELRTLYPDRWVRYYTLPEGERIARTDEQRAEQMHRYLSVLVALGTPALVTTVRWKGSGAAVLPATYWRDAAEYAVYVSAVDSAEDLVPLLRLVADERAVEVIIAPADLSWLVHPYDGGIDVIGPELDFPDWRSPRPDGL